MSIIESIKPSGLSEWQQRVGKLADSHPEAFKRVQTINSSSKDDYNIVYFEPPPAEFWRSEDDRINAPYKSPPQLEGPREYEEVADRGAELGRDRVAEEDTRLQIESEPPLTLEQIGEVEQQIGAGLIEEVIRVAEGEKELAHTLAESKV